MALARLSSTSILSGSIVAAGAAPHSPIPLSLAAPTKLAAAVPCEPRRPQSVLSPYIVRLRAFAISYRKPSVCSGGRNPAESIAATLMPEPLPYAFSKATPIECRFHHQGCVVEPLTRSSLFSRSFASRLLAGKYGSDGGFRYRTPGGMSKLLKLNDLTTGKTERSLASLRALTAVYPLMPRVIIEAELGTSSLNPC